MEKDLYLIGQTNGNIYIVTKDDEGYVRCCDAAEFEDIWQLICEERYDDALDLVEDDTGLAFYEIESDYFGDFHYSPYDNFYLLAKTRKYV